MFTNVLFVGEFEFLLKNANLGLEAVIEKAAVPNTRLALFYFEPKLKRTKSTRVDCARVIFWKVGVGYGRQCDGA